MEENLLHDGNTDFDGYPDPSEVLKRGGLPGCTYALVPGSEIGNMRKQGFDLVKGAQILTIHGPAGTCDNVVVMAQGTPIRGGDTANGIREWYIHQKLDAATGLGPRKEPTHGRTEGKKAEGGTQPPQGQKDAPARQSAG